MPPWWRLNQIFRHAPRRRRLRHNGLNGCTLDAKFVLQRREFDTREEKSGVFLSLLVNPNVALSAQNRPVFMAKQERSPLLCNKKLARVRSSKLARCINFN